MNNIDYSTATYICNDCEQLFEPTSLFQIRNSCPACSRVKRKANAIKFGLILYFLIGLFAILTAFGMGIQLLVPL